MLYQFVADLGVEGIRDEMGAAHALFASGSEVVRDKEGAETPRALGASSYGSARGGSVSLTVSLCAHV